MRQEEFSDKLMSKLAGELSENDAKLFQQEVAIEPDLAEDFAFFEEAWNSLGGISSIEKPAESLSTNFYQKLEELEQQQQNKPTAKLSILLEQFFTIPPFLRHTSFGALLLLFGFILGEKYNTKSIVVNNVVEPVNQPVEQAYTTSTEKINFVRSINHNKEQQNDTFNMLQKVVQNEQNVNVRLAALNKMNQYYANDPMLKRFLAKQFEVEKSTLIQVELLNLMIDNYHTGETIQRMEDILVTKQNLNPFVQEKIKKDLPVLRASYVQ